MRFDPPLVPGVLERRYQRFFADVRLQGGRRVTAHCADPGSMRDIAIPGSEVLLSPRHGKARKLPFTWELIRLGRSWVGVNTALPNRLVDEALAQGRIPALHGYTSRRREVPVGEHTRVDFELLAHGRPSCFVEVKSVTLAQGRIARFPDSVTERGQKHLRELMALHRAGHRAVLLFWVYRGDCRVVTPADDLDPAYGRLLRKAASLGVELLACRAKVTRHGVTAGAMLPIQLGDPT